MYSSDFYFLLFLQGQFIRNVVFNCQGFLIPHNNFINIINKIYVIFWDFNNPSGTYLLSQKVFSKTYKPIILTLLKNKIIGAFGYFGFVSYYYIIFF